MIANSCQIVPASQEVHMHFSFSFNMRNTNKVLLLKKKHILLTFTRCLAIKNHF